MDVSVQLYAPAVLTQYPLNRRLFGPQSQSGGSGEGKNLLLLAVLEPHVVQLLACVNTKC